MAAAIAAGLVASRRRGAAASGPTAADGDLIVLRPWLGTRRSASAAATSRRADDLPGPDSYTRPAITMWRIGDPYSKPQLGGTIIGVNERGYFLGSSSSLLGWDYCPTVFVQELREVPGHDYERIPARTFPVPAATIARAFDLADALRFGYADTEGAEDDKAGSGTEGALRAELRNLYDSIRPEVKADLIADWINTGRRLDHPAHLFCTWAVAPRRAAEQEGPPPYRSCDAPGDLVVAPDDVEQLWRRLCSLEYRIRTRESANDGQPADDLPATDQRSAADTVAERLSALVQIPAATLRSRAAEAAYAYGQDPGTDADPDRFAPPDWTGARSLSWPPQ